MWMGVPQAEWKGQKGLALQGSPQWRALSWSSYVRARAIPRTKVQGFSGGWRRRSGLTATAARGSPEGASLRGFLSEQGLALLFRLAPGALLCGLCGRLLAPQSSRLRAPPLHSTQIHFCYKIEILLPQNKNYAGVDRALFQALFRALFGLKSKF